MSRGGFNNKGGRPKGSKAEHTLKAIVARQELIRTYIENSKEINQALIAKAKEGDIAAIKELHNRVFGQAPQFIDMDVSDTNEPLTDEQIEAREKTWLEFLNRVR